jgi:hypothetical protein
MRSAPSAAFRRLCLSLALLAVTWSSPSIVHADAYPLQVVKTIADTLKPNVLIVLETAESMQDLPGENAASYNEVGADCEDGSRSCRLVGQTGRWDFSGMGANGMYFGTAPPSCTHTETSTYSQTHSDTNSGTSSSTSSSSASATAASTGNQTGSATGTGSNSATASATATASGAATATGTATGSWTVTASNATSVSATKLATSTMTGAAQTLTATNVVAVMATTTSTGTVTLTGTVSVLGTATLTGTGTGTATLTETATITATGTSTESATVTVTGSVTENGTVTAGGSATATGTVTATMTVTLSPGGGTMTSTATSSGTVVVSKTATVASTVVVTASATALGTKSVSQTITATGSTTSTSVATMTSTETVSASSIATGTVTAAVSGGGTSNGTAFKTISSTGTAVFTTTMTGTKSSDCTWTAYATLAISPVNQHADLTRGSNFAGGSCYFSGQEAGVTATGTQSGGTSTTTGSGTLLIGTASGSAPAVAQVTYIDTSTATNFPRNATLTATWTEAGMNVAGIWTGTLAFTGTRLNSTSLSTDTTTTTQVITGTGTACATVTGTATMTGSSTAVLTATSTVSGTGTVTASGSVTGTDTVTATAQLIGNGSVTGNVTVTQVGNVTGTVTATGSGSVTASTTATASASFLVTNTNTVTATLTATNTLSTCGFVGVTDPGNCNASNPTTTGYCNGSGGPCSMDSVCNGNPIKGDFCQFIATSDGSTRMHNETCCSSSNACYSGQWGSCKHGIVTQNTTCASWGDTSCNAALPGDFCAEGQPATMCADSGLWCKDISDCPGSSTTDKCVGATSRMMTVKRALRRAITDYADKVNFGFMNTYQGKGVPATATDARTAIFPYVKLQSCASSKDITETKLLSRGELQKANCFSLTSGPSSNCTIDYGGAGAINSNATLNQITYALVGTNDSRWAIPRSDGSGKYNHQDAAWSSCSASKILPACEFSGQGTGLYEGSYYTFSYKQGTPVTSGDGSMATPVYFSTYMGKYYFDGSDCYNAMDAERTDIVNDGVAGRSAYTLVSPATSPYTVTATGTGTGTSLAIDTSKESYVPVPWSGSSSTSACDATTGAVWNSNVVPFLNCTASQTGTSTSTSTATFTFNGKAISTAQKILMTTARLEKASFGGVDATGKVAPIGCALGDADSYMATVKGNDVANNGGNSPCWSNNIVLVVDGLSNGPGDADTTGAIDCASVACAYNAATNTTLAGCNCSAITKAYTLARAGTQTHVVVNAPATWSTRYPYTYAFLWNLAVAGSPKFDGTPSFGTTEDEVFKAVSDKIAAAAYHFPYTTTAAVAGATTQNPSTQVLSFSPYLYDTSVSYPSWKGSLRAFDTTSSTELKWDAVTVAAAGHPADWTKRRIFFPDKDGKVTQVQISDSGIVSNASTLNSLGLGASSDEAELIIQWLLGKPSLKNPAPLMGATTSSTPIAVGQGASNGLNGSPTFSQNTWKRPQLVYVGGDDGMLHAFFAHAGSMSLGSATYEGGEEAFAFIPKDMLPVITKLYAQGGQKLAVDKGEHIFGLASSPKVKDMCFDSGCASSGGSDWHTVLVMPEGPGGNSPFALDITKVIDETNGLQMNNLKLLWSAPTTSDSTTWDKSLGETTSVPSFYFAGYLSSGSADNRVLFASGYPTKSGATYTDQGLWILNASVESGAVVTNDSVDVSTLTVDDKCTDTRSNQTRTLIADIALARDYSSAATSQNLMAAYVGTPGAILSSTCLRPARSSRSCTRWDAGSRSTSHRR